jgi:hypothetical protein
MWPPFFIILCKIYRNIGRFAEGHSPDLQKFMSDLYFYGTVELVKCMACSKYLKKIYSNSLRGINKGSLDI